MVQGRRWPEKSSHRRPETELICGSRTEIRDIRRGWGTCKEAGENFLGGRGWKCSVSSLGHAHMGV